MKNIFTLNTSQWLKLGKKLGHIDENGRMKQTQEIDDADDKGTAPLETKLKQEILSDVHMFKARLVKLLSDLAELEGDIEWHFDQYSESVGNPER